MKFRDLLESVQGDFQIRIRKAQKGEAGEIMKEIEAAFKDKKINEKEFDMLSAMCGRKMDKLGESEDKKIQKAATKLVIKMKRDGEENKKIIKALTINFPSINALRFLADFKNELVEELESEDLGESEDKKIQKAATKLVIKMKRDGEENKKIIKALTINFPSINALRFLADFKNELVEELESEELEESTYSASEIDKMIKTTYLTLAKLQEVIDDKDYDVLAKSRRIIRDFMDTYKEKMSGK